MKRILPFLLAVFALVIPAQAQTAKNRSDLYTSIDSNLASGQSGGITAAQLRLVTKDIVASFHNFTADGNAVVTSVSYVNPAWLVSIPFSKLTATPTSLAGYGIADPIVLTSGSYANPAWITSLAWTKLTSVPTTAAGFGVLNGAALDALGAVATNGALTRTGAGTAAARTLTGTAAEITVTNGDGAAGNPTLSLPSALTFTGKTITGGTFASPTLTTPALGTPSAAVLTSATGLPLTTGVTGTLPVTNGGTGRATSTTAYGLLAAGTTATGAQQTLAAGLTTQVLVGGGAAALPVWTTVTGTGSPVLATSPTLVTPVISSITAAAASDLSLAGATAGTNAVKITNTTASSSPTTGALQSAGGLGVAGAAYFGGRLNVSSVFSIPGRFESSDINASIQIHSTAAGANSAGYQLVSGGTGSVAGAGGFGLYDSGAGAIRMTIASTGAASFSGALSTASTTASTSTTTGALQSAGGLGVAGAAYIGGQANFQASMPQIVLGAGSNAVNQIGFFYSSGGQYFGLSGNRNPATAVFANTAGTHAGIDLDTGSAGSGITFRTTATPNALGNVALFISKTGSIEAQNPTGGLGYGTGAGGTVTQATSRTTGVTLNKVAGAITLFTAAGSATAASFTVTNSAVAETDTVVLSVKSSTNKYLCFVTAVAAGSFEVTFYTTGGTASDAPVINFAVIKAVTS